MLITQAKVMVLVTALGGGLLVVWGMNMGFISGGPTATEAVVQRVKVQVIKLALLIRVVYES